MIRKRITFATTSGVVSAIAVDATSVYWTDATSVRRLDKDTPGSKATVLAVAQNAPSVIALDDVNVYWTKVGDGLVQSLPKVGPKPGDKPTILATGESAPMGIAVDSSGVYWTNHDDGRIRVIRR